MGLIAIWISGVLRIQYHFWFIPSPNLQPVPDEHNLRDILQSNLSVLLKISQ